MAELLYGIARPRVCRTVKVPETFANRPVPLVIVWCSVNVMVGGAATPDLVKLVEISSPLAAVHVLVPIPPAAVIVQSAVTVNRPRWVALPVASRWWLLGTVSTVSKPSYVPSNGNAEPRSDVLWNGDVASVAAAAPISLNEDDVGPVGATPEHAVAKRQKPSMTYRICGTFSLGLT